MLKECNLLILKANYGTYILIYVLLHNVHTFFLCITNNDAKKVATLRIPEWKVGNKSSDTRTERSRGIQFAVG